MGAWPLAPVPWVPPSEIGTLSPSSVGGLGSISPGTATWPVANRVFYVPFWLAGPITAQRMFWPNGGTLSGNVQAGLYSADGARLGTTGTVAQAGANADQFAALTAAVLLGAGLFYFALTVDNTTAVLLRYGPSAVGIAQASGMATETPGSFGLPATATFGVTGSQLTYIPVVGLSRVTSP